MILKRKNKNLGNLIKKSSFIILLIFSIGFPVISSANSQSIEISNSEINNLDSELKNNISKTNKVVKESIVLAQQKIELENKIKQAKMEKSNRLEKLKADKSKFIAQGAQNISEDNMFYPIAKTGLTAEEINIGLAGTDLAGTGEAFKKVEDEYGVNPIFLVAIANHESYYGSSNIAKVKNNLFGFNANDSNPMGDASVYSSYSDCIIKVGAKLKKLYLSDNGIYFGGYSSYGVNKRYSTDPGWPDKVNNQMIKFTDKLINNWK